MREERHPQGVLKSFKSSCERLDQDKIGLQALNLLQTLPGISW